MSEALSLADYSQKTFAERFVKEYAGEWKTAVRSLLSNRGKTAFPKTETTDHRDSE